VWKKNFEGFYLLSVGVLHAIGWAWLMHNLIPDLNPREVGYVFYETSPLWNGWLDDAGNACNGVGLAVIARTRPT
jgi:hypothetical protein